MIRYIQGNLLEADAEALVNTVNTEGVMGKGIALQFKEAFPDTYEQYRQACEKGEVRVGRVFVTRNPKLVGPKWIIHFPTKEAWRKPSRLEYLEKGLSDLVRVVRELGIRSIALPPLGCGHGGLDWYQVRPLIADAMGELSEVDVLVFEPTVVYQGGKKRGGVEQLTPARALLVEAVRRYGMLGFDCTNLEIQKLAYFLQRVLKALSLPDVLQLQFVAHKYGPYADKLRHLLNDLDGSYLHCEKRLADAGPLDPIVIDGGRLDRVKGFLHSPEGSPYVLATEKTAEIWDGFQSPYHMELLATVDWLMAQAKRDLSNDEIMQGISRWPGGPASAKRKSKLFPSRVVEIARKHLAGHSKLLYP